MGFSGPAENEAGQIYLLIRSFVLQAAQSIKSYPDLTLLSHLRETPSGRNGIVLHAGNKIRAHNGMPLAWRKDNSHAFDEVDVTGMYEINGGRRFCLIPSLEYIELPPNYIGWLWDYSRKYNPTINPYSPKPTKTFMTHPNAPAILPGAEGNQIHEVWHMHNLSFGTRREEELPLQEYYHHGMRLGAGKPISIMSLHALDQLPEQPYNGKYKGQKGPQVSLSHKD